MSPDALETGTQVGRWRVVECLGVGGQGAVYRVEDLDHPGDFYALKLALHAHDRRAEREVALTMTRAAHPHVVGVHGCARWPHPREGCLGILMEWVPGQALDVWAEREETTFHQLAQAGATVARTLDELHARSVLHRDLKPEHILIREEDGQPVLLDFGAGWYAGAAPLTTGPLPPTTCYLVSPEAVRFLWHSPEHPGARYAFRPTDDLYALGVCLYRATTGHYPFSEWLPADLLQYAILHEPARAPMLVNPRVPRALNDVIVRLLMKNPAERYPSGAALHEALVTAAREKGSWDVSIFAREQVLPSNEGKRPERELLRPPKPLLPTPAPLAPMRSRESRPPRRLLLAMAVMLVLVPVLRLLQLELGLLGPGWPWATDARTGPGAAADEQAPRPVRNQKMAPCTAKLEVEISGACWFPHKERPPDCPPQTLPYRGECLLPVSKPNALPTSMDGGAQKTH